MTGETTSNFTAADQSPYTVHISKQTKISMLAKQEKTRGDSASSVTVGAASSLHTSSTPAPSISEPNTSTGNHIKHSLPFHLRVWPPASPRLSTKTPRPLREAVRSEKNFPEAGEDSEAGGNIGIYTKSLYFPTLLKAFTNTFQSISV